MTTITPAHRAALKAEVARRKARGETQLSVPQLAARFAALGYALDRSSDCRSWARYVTGPDAGASYPACTTGVREADTGRSAFHVESRRDEQFRQMQALRSAVFAVSNGYVLEV